MKKETSAMWFLIVFINVKMYEGPFSNHKWLRLGGCYILLSGTIWGDLFPAGSPICHLPACRHMLFLQYNNWIFTDYNRFIAEFFLNSTIKFCLSCEIIESHNGLSWKGP